MYAKLTLDLACRKDSAFVKTAARLVQTSLHTVSDATSALKSVLDFPFNTTLGTSEVSSILEDNFKEVSFHLSSLLGTAAP